MTPPLDLAALARDYLHDNGHVFGTSDVESLVAKLTLSHAAGRAEGLEEAAKVGEEYANRLDGEKWRGVWELVSRIRSLASDPAPGDQVAEDGSCYDGFDRHGNPTPVPALAHPTEPGEVERPTWPADCRQPNSCSRHQRCGYLSCVHQHRDIRSEINAALSAPRPSQPKGPTE